VVCLTDLSALSNQECSNLLSAGTKPGGCKFYSRREKLEKNAQSNQIPCSNHRDHSKKNINIVVPT